MIEITVRGKSIDITGHANYDEHGKDIVCASVSALYMALCNTTLQARDDGLLSCTMMQSSKRKLLEIDSIDISYSEKYNAVWKSILDMIEWIAEEYPENVKITKK